MEFIGVFEWFNPGFTFDRAIPRFAAVFFQVKRTVQYVAAQDQVCDRRIKATKALLERVRAEVAKNA